MASSTEGWKGKQNYHSPKSQGLTTVDLGCDRISRCEVDLRLSDREFVRAEPASRCQDFRSRKNFNPTSTAITVHQASIAPHQPGRRLHHSKLHRPFPELLSLFRVDYMASLDLAHISILHSSCYYFKLGCHSWYSSDQNPPSPCI